MNTINTNSIDCLPIESTEQKPGFFGKFGGKIINKLDGYFNSEKSMSSKKIKDLAERWFPFIGAALALTGGIACLIGLAFTSSALISILMIASAPILLLIGGIFAIYATHEFIKDR